VSRARLPIGSQIFKGLPERSGHILEIDDTEISAVVVMDFAGVL
jgi:hypothetical protein